MKITMKQWEIERVKEIVAEVLDFGMYDFIEVKNKSGRSMSMSKQTFLEALDRALKNE